MSDVSQRRAMKVLKDVTDILTHYGPNAESFAALISAIRGPDYPSDEYKVKETSTNMIRGALVRKFFPRRGLDMTGMAVREYNRNRFSFSRARSEHFKSHMERAIHALKRLGVVKE